MPKPTQMDIAKRAGVDRSVVSKVLSGRMGKTSVRKELEEKILAAAQELGYQPNLAAQAVKTGKFNSIAMIMSNHSERSYAPSDLINSLHDELARNNKHLSLARIEDEKLEDPDYIPQILKTLMSDGLIVNYTHHIPMRLIELLHDSVLPVIWLNQRRRFDAIYPNNLKASEELTQKLIEKGHRNIAYFDADVSEKNLSHFHFSDQDRFKGYMSAMKKAGLEPEVRLPPFENKDCYDWLEKSPCTAIVAKWICWAPPILKHFYTREGQGQPLRSLVSFNSEQSANYGLEFVAGMVEPETQLGIEAAKMILEKIDKPEVSLPSKEIDFKFHDGETLLSLNG